MKLNKSTLIIAPATLLFGLLIGWFVFGATGSAENGHEGHQHQTEKVDGETTWTCSMHPQIRQPEEGDCPICGMDLIPLEEQQGEDINPQAVKMSEMAMQLASVRTEIVKATEPVKTLRLNGKVETDERRIASQSSHIPGRVEKLTVSFTGEFVNKGQIIASVYSPDLVTAQEELFEAENIRDSQPQLFTAAKEKLKNWKLTESQIERILQAGQPEEVFDIQSDISGFVASRKVNVGDYISRGQVIYEIADLSQVWVLFDVYEQDIPWIKKGDQVSFSVASIPGETFEGTISFLDPVIDAKTRVAKARVEMANSSLKLKPEMFASGRVEARLLAKAATISVPKSAVMWTGKRSLVYVKSETETGVNFLMREVTLGPALGSTYLIEGGLDEGEEIAVSGTFSIDAAAQLAGKPSMMQRPEAKTMEVPQVFREQITAVAIAYFEVKNALVDDAPESAQKLAGSITVTLGNVDMSLLEGEAHHQWMPLQEQLKKAAKMISQTADIDEQRKHFNMLSEAMLETTESFGLEIDKVYRLFCPMAFDDIGAFWLSESDEILNPYFGDMMLRCGEVKQTYRKGQRVFQPANNQNTQATGHNH
jgi:membrane fusion protein, copper/silver efflux system